MRRQIVKTLGRLLSKRTVNVLFGLCLTVAVTACGQGSNAATIDSPATVVGAAVKNAASSETSASPDSKLASVKQANTLFISLPDLPGGSLSHHTMTVTGAGMVVAGGVNRDGKTVADLLIFDDQLARFVTLPVSMTFARQQHSATALPGADGLLGTRDDGVLVVGGCQETEENGSGVELLRSVEAVFPDPNADGFYDDAFVESLTSLPYKLAGHCAVNLRLTGLENRPIEVLLVGGMTSGLVKVDEPTPTNESWIYQVSSAAVGQLTSNVVEIGHPSFARNYHSLSQIPGPDQVYGSNDDQFLVFGGRGYEVLSENEEPLSQSEISQMSFAIDTIEVFDYSSRRWSRVVTDGPSDLLRGRYRHRAVMTEAGLLVVGGIDEAEDVQKECLLIEQDPDLNQVFRVSSAGRLNNARELPELVPIDAHRWLVVGGFERDSRQATGEVLNSVEVYDPLQQPRFHLLPENMGRPRVYHKVKHYSGRIIVVGGFDSPRQEQVPDAEFVYSPNSIK